MASTVDVGRAQGLNLPAINAEVDRRGFVPVSEKMEVLDKSGKPVTNVFCIGDANGAPTPHFPENFEDLQCY